jgi:DNA-binding response OmpR family regulator
MAKKILVIEDEESLLKVLIEKFTIEKFEVFSARDGIDGLTTALKERPDLILLDIIMPKMDGLTMLKELRKDESGKKIKVIMLTNLSGEENIADAIRSGSFDYLIKSDWKIEDLVKRVKEVLS